jgi:signal transduction histidine kinase
VISLQPSATRKIAWSVGLVSIGLLVASIVILYVDRNALPTVDSSTVDSNTWNFGPVLGAVGDIAVAVTGMLIAIRRPGHTLGWLFLTAGFALAMQTFGSVYAQHLLQVHDGPVMVGRLFAWIGNWMWAIPTSCLLLLFFLFPTGTVLSPRWRPVIWAILIYTVVLSAVAISTATSAWSNPFLSIQSSGRAAETLFIVAGVLIPVGLVMGLVSIILRYRRSRGDERLQMKWFVTAAAFVVVTFSFQVWAPNGVGTLLSNIGLLFLWTAIAISILKYRLWEIDVVINRAVVLGSLVVFITAVYVGLVVGIGTAVGNRRSPLLSAIAAAVVALAFQPVRAWAQKLANRLVYGKRATPYEVLSDFAERIAGTYASEDVLPRMASIVAAGTGADRAVVWLRVGGELHAEASSNGFPSTPTLRLHGGDLPVIDAAGTAVPVRHQGELLGAISVHMPQKEALSSAGERLIADVASQAGLVLSNARLIEELRASRQRLVAAQDAERRKLERNLHDGAQQQLVALAVKQRLAATLVVKDPAAASQMLEALQQETTEALENLRDLARGIYPPLLADQGLGSALTAQARKAAIPVEVRSDGVGRYPQDTEAAVYFCCLEAIQNVAKYANANRVVLRLASKDGTLAFEVTDDGVGFDPDRTPFGSGMQNMADRLAAVGGSLDVRSSPGNGTTVTGSLPAVELPVEERAPLSPIGSAS